MAETYWVEEDMSHQDFLIALDRTGMSVVRQWQKQGDEGRRAAQALQHALNVVRTYSSEQPAPQDGRVVIVDELIRDLEARKQLGLERYGTPLKSHNGRAMLADVYAELEDALIYMKGVQIEHPELFEHE